MGVLKSIALIPSKATLGGGSHEEVGSASQFTPGESDD
jgi:hypothetical protein